MFLQQSTVYTLLRSLICYRIIDVVERNHVPMIAFKQED